MPETLRKTLPSRSRRRLESFRCDRPAQDPRSEPARGAPIRPSRHFREVRPPCTRELSQSSHPDKPAYVMAASGETVTYRELDERSNRCAQLLRARSGLAAGRRHRDLHGEPPALLRDRAGRRSARASTTPRSATRLTAAEVEYIVNDCGAKVFIASDGTARRRRRRSAAHPRSRDARSWSAARCAGLRALRGRGRAAARATRSPTSSRARDLLYSSGTTGRPKGVQAPAARRAARHAARAGGAAQRRSTASTSDTVYLSPAPLYHAAPLRFCMAVHRLGGTVVVMEHFDADASARADRALPRHPQPVGADDVRAHAQARPKRARALRPRRACASRSTPPRPARSRSRSR